MAGPYFSFHNLLEGHCSSLGYGFMLKCGGTGDFWGWCPMHGLSVGVGFWSLGRFVSLVYWYLVAYLILVVGHWQSGPAWTRSSAGTWCVPEKGFVVILGL